MFNQFIHHMKKLKKAMIYLLIAFAGYLVIGYFLHLVVFPEKKPEISSYFTPGDQFNSIEEGFKQTVVDQEDGLVYCNLVVEPYASGPPKHIHTEFDEYFEVKNGELSVWVDGEVKKIKPGEVVHIPKGTPHKPFNETSEIIHLKESFAMPEQFAFYLSQVYDLMDNHPSFGKMPSMLLMLAPLHQSGFDSFLAEGPPVFVQKFTAFLLTPMSRIMGYKSYYKPGEIRSRYALNN